MNRGDVWEVDLGGRAGRRPVVILTRQAVMAHVNKVTVAEITTKGKGYPTEVAIGQAGNLRRDSFVELDNVQTVSKTRFVRHVGTLNSDTMRTVGRKLILALELETCV